MAGGERVPPSSLGWYYRINETGKETLGVRGDQKGTNFDEQDP